MPDAALHCTGGPRFSLIIPTYNRPALLERALAAALRQGPDLEILVVDDASPNSAAADVCAKAPQVRYVRQPANQGPGAARQRGLELARGRWVLLVDDDDELAPQALKTVAEAISDFPAAENFPVLQFACHQRNLKIDFLTASLDDYLQGVLQGDNTPVIHRQTFLAAGLTYPATRLGGEHILWWSIAARWGIPTWNRKIVTVNADAPSRLTSFKHQVQHASEHARIQEMSLEALSAIDADLGAFRRKRRLGAATYWLLAGRRRSAWLHLKQLYTEGYRGPAAALFALSIVPAFVLKPLFMTFRRLTVG